jgi:hypothetical protein
LRLNRFLTKNKMSVDPRLPSANIISATAATTATTNATTATANATTTAATTTQTASEWTSIQKEKISFLKSSIEKDSQDYSVWEELLRNEEFEFVLEKFPTFVDGWLRWLGRWEVRVHAEYKTARIPYNVKVPYRLP